MNYPCCDCTDPGAIDPTRATLVRHAADGLWLSALRGLPRLDPEIRPEMIRAPLRLTRA